MNMTLEQGCISIVVLSMKRFLGGATENTGGLFQGVALASFVFVRTAVEIDRYVEQSVSHLVI